MLFHAESVIHLKVLTFIGLLLKNIFLLEMLKEIIHLWHFIFVKTVKLSLFDLILHQFDRSGDDSY